MKKNIIFYLNNDELFTFPIALFLLKKINLKYNIYLKLADTSLRKKIKIILILFLDGNILNLYKFYKKKITLKKLLSLKNIKVIESNQNKKFEFGISLNYPKKILNLKHKIYNFHFGNFKTQRGTFIFFYKYLYNWNDIDLTFHQISEKLDDGKILNKISINTNKMNSLELIALPLKYKIFYWNSFKKINKETKKYKSIIGPTNKEPSLLKILNSKFKNKKNN